METKKIMLRIKVSQANSQAATIQQHLKIEAEGTAGRSASNDLHLPDPSRIVSSFHCTFFKRDHSFYVRDESSNGTFVNDPDLFLSSGDEYRISDGDVLSIGDYKLELSVEEVSEQEELATSDTSSQLQETIKQFEKLAQSKLQTPAEDRQQPLADASKQEPATSKAVASSSKNVDISSIESQIESLLQTSQPPTNPELAVNQDSFTRKDSNPAQMEPVSKAQVLGREVQTPSSDLNANSLKQLFALSADVDYAAIAHLSDEQLVQMAGTLLKQFSAGLVKSLQVRAHIKAESSANRTMVVPTENNQLKFSIDGEDGLAKLVGKPKKGYMSPQKAVGCAFEDIQNTLIQTLEKQDVEKKRILMELNPSSIEKHVTHGKKGFSITTKNQFWNQYKKRYQNLSKLIH